MALNYLHDLDDSQLLILLKSENELAFKVIYNRYWKRLFIYTRNILNDKGLAEDVLHEIFVNIWVKKDDIEILSLEKYLFTSAKNKSISQFRKMKFTAFDDDIIQNLCLTPEADHSLEATDLKSTLERVTKNLPTRCKEIFYMSRYDSYSNEEIANHFNISQRTVENQLYLALKHVRVALRKVVTILLSTLFF
ncbi:RNA polymerase sigma-70 factor [Flavobacteriaceae bacterium F08102]|nr:RNA polymerase sigma-70 factor [Flavobacteriaceae bacterium F08102]